MEKPVLSWLPIFFLYKKKAGKLDCIWDTKRTIETLGNDFF